MERLPSAPLLHLHSGVPVVAIAGEWDNTMYRTLAETVGRLAQSGHFEIIVNLSQTGHLPFMEQNWREQMERLAACVSAHCGHLHLVGTLEQVRGCFGSSWLSRVQWAVSEEEAVGRIKGVPVWKSGSKVTTRFSCSGLYFMQWIVREWIGKAVKPSFQQIEPGASSLCLGSSSEELATVINN